MNYFYFNPLNKQYYFPEGFVNKKFFQSFYQPYTLKGRILWYLWLNISIFQNKCIEKNPEKVLPIKQLEPFIHKNSILAFNLGTRGVEQKTTILGFVPKKKEKFFIKYAETNLSKKNVKNEGSILSQLDVQFAPRLEELIETKDFTLIKTQVLKGGRFVNENVGKKIYNILKVLHSQNISANKYPYNEVKLCFAHGDFCPWNIMIHKKKLYVYDWEMAGYYPLGFDLFTYIFQTAFLINPKRSVKDTFKLYELSIQKYFKKLYNEPWLPYLQAFAMIKYQNEKKKNNAILTNRYKELFDFFK